MQSDFTFTKSQLINAINNWALEPLTDTEKSYLTERINEQEEHTYGQNDIESLLLEYLSDMEDQILAKLDKQF